MMARARVIGGIPRPRVRTPYWLGRHIWYPLAVDEQRRGRLELFVGAPGAGKTTAAFLRCMQLGAATDRDVWTTNLSGEQAGFGVIRSFDELESLRNVVVFIDEIQFLFPAVTIAGLTDKDMTAHMGILLSQFRHYKLCIIGTTQAWSRVSVGVREMCTQVWPCEPVGAGWHRTMMLSPPQDRDPYHVGPSYYRPEWCTLDTHSDAWAPYLDKFLR